MFLSQARLCLVFFQCTAPYLWNVLLAKSASRSTSTNRRAKGMGWFISLNRMSKSFPDAVEYYRAATWSLLLRHGKQFESFLSRTNLAAFYMYGVNPPDNSSVILAPEPI